VSEIWRTAAKAHRAFREGDFAAAARHFEELVEQGAGSADVWFNLGSAHYRAGRKGRAAWAWENALRVDPGDEEARASLERVRAELPRAEVRVEAPLVEDLGARLDGDRSAIFLLAGWTFGCVFLLLRRRFRSQRWFAGLLAATAFFAAMVGGVGLFLVERHHRAGWAVVLESTPLRSAPHDGAEAIRPLAEGSRVRVERFDGDWALLRGGEGPGGWVPTAALGKIGY
jgi:hypothetical protein